MFNNRHSMYFPEIPNPNESKNKTKPEKICLISAVVLLFALLGFIWYTGLYILYIHFWVYVAVASLIITLLLTAGAFAIYHHVSSERTQKRVGIVVSGFVIAIAAVLIIFTTGISTTQKPVSFSDSPNGENRIVIMKSMSDTGALITAYPAIGNHFYVAALTSEVVHSNGVIQGVEWEGERLARVLLCDINGNDTTLTVDFSLLYGD